MQPVSFAHTPYPDEAGFILLGKTPQMLHLRSQIQKIARTDASVLVYGASGCGKEVTARAIHSQSSRRHAPFVSLDCSTLASHLFESELFGHEKNAFNDAHQCRIGRIEAAHGGTLFLDEIGDIPLDMQARLLRFLQEKTLTRIGGSEAHEIDVRVIVATRSSLEEAVHESRFREDLYYRLNVVGIDLPPLADRGEDIEEIAKHYFSCFANEHNRSLRGFSKAAMDAMLRHAWPGNVRELVNRVQRATVMAEGRFIQPEDLGFERDQPTQMMSLEDARAAAECATIKRALQQSRNQISRAASLLGVSRVTLYRLIEKYNIRADMAAATRLTPVPAVASMMPVAAIAPFRDEAFAEQQA